MLIEIIRLYVNWLNPQERVQRKQTEIEQIAQCQLELQF